VADVLTRPPDHAGAAGPPAEAIWHQTSQMGEQEPATRVPPWVYADRSPRCLWALCRVEPATLATPATKKVASDEASLVGQ